MRPSARREQVGTGSKISGGLSVIGYPVDFLCRNRTPDPDLDLLARFIQEFIGQTGGAKHGMNQSQQVKGQAIPASAKYWNRNRLGNADQPRSRFTPLRVYDLGVTELPMGNLSRAR